MAVEDAPRVTGRPAGRDSSDGRTLYELLGVKPGADGRAIQHAYRSRARLSHPDLNAGSDAAERMRELNAAYEVLSDPARRLIYDLELRKRGGTASRGVERRSGPLDRRRSVRRLTTCWSCVAQLDPRAPYCAQCHWTICDECRSCGCDNPRRKKRLQRERLRVASPFIAVSIMSVLAMVLMSVVLSATPATPMTSAAPAVSPPPAPATPERQLVVVPVEPAASQPPAIAIAPAINPEPTAAPTPAPTVEPTTVPTAVPTISAGPVVPGPELPPPAPPEPGPAEVRRAVVANGGQGARLRSAPNTRGEVLEVVADNTQLVVLPGEQREGSVTWREVETATGKRGWMAESLFRLIEPNAPAPGAPAVARLATLQIAGGGQGARLREAPSSQARVLEVLADRTAVADLGGEQQEGDRAWREVESPSGRRGWVSADLLGPAPGR